MIKASKVYKLLAKRETKSIPNTESRNSQWYRDMDLFCSPRDLKNQQEYEYLKHTSKQLFCTNVLGASWVKGYVIEVTPVRSKEAFYILDFLLEDGNFVSFPFALSAGLDSNIQNLFSVLGVELIDDTIPPEIFFQELLLLVSSNLEGEELSFYLHDVASLGDKQNKNNITKGK